MPIRSIAQKADILATFRYVAVFLMETTARWTPLTPELEVKLLFGRHLWEFAQHADILGQRTAELRAGLHYTRPPIEAYKQVLDEQVTFETAADRVTSIYDALVPDLTWRYEEILRDADPLLDQPTIRIVERILADLARLQVERREMLAGVAVPAADPEWTAQLQRRLAAHLEFTNFRPSRESTA
jgi:hypothetical protein